MRVSALSDFVVNLAQRRFAFLPRAREEQRADIETLCNALVSRKGEVSCYVIAEEIFARWEKLSTEQKRECLLRMSQRFAPDREAILTLVKEVEADPSDSRLYRLHRASEPKAQELLRRLNHASNGTKRLVAMRETLLDLVRSEPSLATLDNDFSHLFSSWFNRGFLEIKPITWDTPAAVLEKIIKYEAVHEITDWDELRRRIAPEDRRLFAFFHPQMQNEPLIFVEVALTRSVPSGIDEVLRSEREIVPRTEATTAVFYSISNCQRGLRGISFGNFLIKQVVEELRRELPNLQTFVTLSPVPDFARWLTQLRQQKEGLQPVEADLIARLEKSGWPDAKGKAESDTALRQLAAIYFTSARDRHGRPLDSVARFHLGNGARLENIHARADLSPKGLENACGLMVNYLYNTADIEKNHENFAENGTIVVSDTVQALLKRN